MLPTDVGVNETFTVQEFPLARVPVQVFPERANCVPVVSVTEVKVMVEPLLLVSVTVRAELVLLLYELPKLMLIGDTVTAPEPVPDNETVSGLDGSLLTTTREATSELVVLGVKVKVIVHVPAGARDVPLAQVPPATAKSGAFAPLMVMALEEARIRLEVPELVIVTVKAALVTP